MRKGFKNWLGERGLPPRMTKEEADECLAGISDIQNQRKMIEGHLRLAFALVARYAAAYPRKTDDMVGEAILALVAGVKSISEGAITHHEEPNPSGYLYLSMCGAILEFINKDRIIGCSATSFRRGIKLPKVRYIVREPIARTTTSAFDVRDFVNSKIEDERERKILGLYMDGFSGEDIAQVFGLSRERVRQIKQHIATILAPEMNYVFKGN